MTEMVLLSACIMVPLDISAQSALRQLGCHCSFTLALLLHAFDMGSSYRSFIYSRLGGCCTALHFSFSLVLHVYAFLISILSSLLFFVCVCHSSSLHTQSWCFKCPYGRFEGLHSFFFTPRPPALDKEKFHHSFLK
ncbi:hypothetical protein I7I53_06512 [Histoplasma capsulatum var. duboisii H88]|uniref:Secreted protein n=1 Tax=Ajellomyces capsulatus (strain H88) TaxID=544711 RepID=A0A8A1LBC3_AJEC8|nr:hypothetical protein I7I53_06512 [Histoplasma capsulatum var. duboisii H88]